MPQTPYGNAGRQSPQQAIAYFSGLPGANGDQTARMMQYYQSHPNATAFEAARSVLPNLDPNSTGQAMGGAKPDESLVHGLLTKGLPFLGASAAALTGLGALGAGAAGAGSAGAGGLSGLLGSGGTLGTLGKVLGGVGAAGSAISGAEHQGEANAIDQEQLQRLQHMDAGRNAIQDRFMSGLQSGAYNPQARPDLSGIFASQNPFARRVPR